MSSEESGTDVEVDTNDYSSSIRFLARARDENPLQRYFLEEAPDSSRYAKCRLFSCGGDIEPGKYRITVVRPGIWGGTKDFYHVECFEKIVDFSEEANCRILVPLTRNSCALRGLRGTQVMDGQYFLDGGASKLTWEWLRLRMEWFAAQRGESENSQDTATENDQSNPTSNSDQVAGQSENLRNGQLPLALFDSDNSDSEEEGGNASEGKKWDPFEEYLNRDMESSLNDRHSLSDMLAYWYWHRRVIYTREEYMTDELREVREEMGPKTIKAIKRFSTVYISVGWS